MCNVFFLNDLMSFGRDKDIEVQREFEKTMYCYAHLRKEALLDIKEYVVIACDAYSLKLGNMSLCDLVKNIVDRDLRVACTNYFLKYDNVITNNYILDDIENDSLEEILSMKYHNGKELTNAAIASVKSWFLLSLPIEIEWRNSSITLDSTSKYLIRNFYGINRYDVVDYLLAGKETQESYLIRFKHCLDNYSIEFSESFREKFFELQVEEIKNMLSRLQLAESRSLIAQNAEDKNLYRHCTCIGNGMYELKSSHNMGIRYYLRKENENTLIFGGVGRKSNYKGEKQNNDMKRAYTEIEKYSEAKNRNCVL